MYFYEKIDRNELQKLILESTSIAEVLRKLNVKDRGRNHTLLKKYLQDENFDTSTLVGRSISRNNNRSSYKTLYEELVENGSSDSNKLKGKLIRYGIKEEKCESPLCSNPYRNTNLWGGEKLILELHHINGNHTDNRLENLILLCPNCHSLTKNFRGRNSTYESEKSSLEILKEKARKDAEIKLPILIKQHLEAKQHNITQKFFLNKKEKIKKIYGHCACCGKELTRKQNKYCSVECLNKDKNKNRPSKEEILEASKKCHSLSELNKYFAKYNVTDTAIKKWCNKYGIYSTVKSNFLKKTKTILQYNLDGSFIKEWESGDLIQKELGFNKSHIQLVCSGHQKTSNGYIWKYK